MLREPHELMSLSDDFDPDFDELELEAEEDFVPALEDPDEENPEDELEDEFVVDQDEEEELEIVVEEDEGYGDFDEEDYEY